MDIRRSSTSASPSDLPRDVRTIILTALEKDRERRYQSALGLAKDIQRWRRGEAIEARSPSFGYQLTVFVRRNRIVVGAVAALVLAMAIGLVVSSRLYLEAKRAEAEADEHRERAVAALSFMQDMIFSADPVRIGDRIQVGDLLDRYCESVGDAFAGQPEIEAEVRTTLGNTYLNLDLFERVVKGEAYRESARRELSIALQLREQALGEEHPDTLDSMDVLANVLADHGRLSDAEPLAVDAYAVCEASSLPEAEEALEPLEGLAELRLRQDRIEETLRLYRTLVERLSDIHGTDSWAARRARGRLGGLLMEQGRVEEAAALFHNKSMPDAFGVEEWLQGETPIAGDAPTVIVLWESWCPFSQKLVPDFQVTSRPYRARGLSLVGLSRAREPEGRSRLTEFIRNKELTFPAAISDDDAWRYFEIGGTPSAAAAKDGQIVFQGRLENVTPAFLERLLED